MSRHMPLSAEPVFATCQFGQSRLRFRAQETVLGRADVTVLGSGISFGRFCREPWPDLLARGAGLRLRNLAVPQTGPEAWAQDDDLMALALRSSLQIVELPCCLRVSNRFWQLHPRRNDRIIRVLPPLKALYPELDLAEVIFSGHLLRLLESICPRRFALVQEAAARAWLDRMGALLADLPGPVVLLWLHMPQPRALSPGADLVQALRNQVRAVVEVNVSPPPGAQGPEGHFPDAASHRRIADRLRDML
ncbi:DUF6473 family protein [Falsigemmobacter faecalis]|uniref:DUF6473 domain-containing protein n=1 Tax=Falsigemmobacter faecalis TaxID=2488730 RepID=A0A3P3DRS3_9RHOB|nr:DUF6473 family protein [Falsigemmobacter faecalis]RRH76960.1 hypothetical protein EG244_04980 [Falsigemmobacter faecalis]